MKANELQIIIFLQTPRVQFVIPVYQRNYDWTTVECGEIRIVQGGEIIYSSFNRALIYSIMETSVNSISDTLAIMHPLLNLFSDRNKYRSALGI